MKPLFAAAIASLCAAAPLATPAFAQERFPVRPVEMLVPSSPGGGSDTTFRLLAELAEPELGQKVVILNRPGGSGSVTGTALATARPDGYTVAGIYGEVITVVPHTLPVTYTPANFVPISLSVTVPLVFCVKPSFPARTGAEFLAALKANPGKFTYGTDGVGGAVHLAAERIFSQVGAKARMIPFTDSNVTLKNFLGDHVHIYAAVIGIIQPYVRTGEARCVLLTTAEKNTAVPDAAGLAELKLAHAATLIWRGVIGVRGTPDDRLKILEAAFSKAARHDRFREFMSKQGGNAQGAPATELGAMIQRDYEAFGGLVRSLGLARK